ncbi:MAG: hypothetical protein KGJ62_10565 [Armatimonadetes bacterium]|nr:hypothetical protein [Armatimonadota bacterium]MDE2207142.1 hypothetical protein [Armatimonadota bacterium]
MIIAMLNTDSSTRTMSFAWFIRHLSKAVHQSGNVGAILQKLGGLLQIARPKDWRQYSGRQDHRLACDIAQWPVRFQQQNRRCGQSSFENLVGDRFNHFVTTLGR